MAALRNALPSPPAPPPATVLMMRVVKSTARAAKKRDRARGPPTHTHACAHHAPARMTKKERSEIHSALPKMAMLPMVPIVAAMPSPPSPVLADTPVLLTHVVMLPSVRLTNRTRGASWNPTNRPFPAVHVSMPLTRFSCAAVAGTPDAAAPPPRHTPVPAMAYVICDEFTPTTAQRPKLPIARSPLGRMTQFSVVESPTAVAGASNNAPVAAPFPA
jgi:hypothetical protein